MDIRKLDDTLTRIFFDEVKHTERITSSSISDLAKISSILLCLWHPAIQEQIKKLPQYSEKQDILNKALEDAVLGTGMSGAAEDYIKSVGQDKTGNPY